MSPGAYIFHVRREICVFKIDWASLVVGRKFAIFVLFYLFCIRGQISSTSPPGAYIRRGDLTDGFLRYDFGGLIFGGAYFWNFTVCSFAYLL